MNVGFSMNFKVIRNICMVVMAMSIGVLPSSTSLSATNLAQVRASIAEYLTNPTDFPLETRRRVDVLERFYLANEQPLLWERNDLRMGLVDRMGEAQIDGLQPTDYPIEKLRKLSDIFEKTDATGKAVIELWFSTYFLKYAQDLKVGRFIPGKIDPKLYWQPKQIDVIQALRQVDGTSDLDVFFNGWQPSIPDYRRLRWMLREFYKIADKGGWPQVSPGDALKPGMSDPRVTELRERIEVENGPLQADPNADPAEYDGELVKAVQKFQRRHGLEPDGVVGKRSMIQLNVPVKRRITQIIVNMERWRWMPERLGVDHIMVNIAGFELRRLKANTLKEKMRVVVGKPYHATPVFSDKIEYVEINPYWNVPHSIATKEELPKLQKDPGPSAAKGMEAIIAGEPIDVRNVDWRQYSVEKFPIRLRQMPGPRNALGRVKLIFPNRFNVYMHDTPARSLFSRSQRAFSHGCIRLARPLDLTEQVLFDVPGWTRARIESVLASKKNTRVRLGRPLPVHITYATAWLDEHGDVQFRSDIYYRDVKLYNAIDGRVTAPMY